MVFVCGAASCTGSGAGAETASSLLGGSGSGSGRLFWGSVILAVVLPRGTMPSSAIPSFSRCLSSFKRRDISFLSAFIIFFARTVLHFSQVISLRSVITEPLRYLVTFSPLRRFIPQPVFFSLSVPCTSSFMFEVTRVISITISSYTAGG